MSQQVYTAASKTEKVAVPQYLIISILTILAIGSQYFSNLSYILNQGVIQNGLELSSKHLLYPSTLSNLAFALGVPFGPVLSRKFGLRRNYLMLIFIFLCGSIISALSPVLVILIVGRIIQGLSAGVLFLTILPVSLKSFPNAIRNTFLFMVITGLFGASAIGALFGSISLRADAWRWLYILNIVASLCCLIIGFLGLPKNEEHGHDHSPVDKTGVFLLSLLMIVLAFPLCNLLDKGFASLYVWPFLLIGLILLILFIYVDVKAETPLVPFRTLKATKPISGTIMAVASHVSLIVAIAGINGFLRNNMNLPFVYLSHFYFWFFVGIVFTAIFKTLFYDKLGAGVLGIIGSLVVLYVSIKWRVIGPETSLHSLYFQVACLGGGVSMTLVSGALGTALAGDIHKASMRSVTLHSIRNFIGAVISPVIGWFITTQNAQNFEDIRGQLDPNSSEFKWEMTKLIRSFMGNHLSLSEAKSKAAYELVANSKKSAVLGAYHDLFTILLILSIIMLIGSIGKTLTGKGRSLVQKQTRLLLPAPKEKDGMETSA
ncbi:Major Facilitator Superfamily protein [Bacillus sp. OV166]|uniref:MFS transporter n=1 Tax=Bacillus sp. OV166 TaxID=1882763 RepID=UPI000A2AB3B8|nr:MFS transporter [Bacillus sp. OV166]SMQ87045.1 Major Facilitator Superfamily protein [Bacillus sp. OV166]